MKGVWQVDFLPVGTDPGVENPTLLISSDTPLDAFLPFFGQAVRVHTLSLDASAHVNKAFVGALVSNQYMWYLLNMLVVDDLGRRKVKSQVEPRILGRLALVECSVRTCGSGDRKVHPKEVGDPSYLYFNANYIFYSDKPQGVWQVDMHHPNTNTDIATDSASSLISHITPLKLFFSPLTQAMRIDSLAHGTSAHIREIFLNALVCDQNTWDTFNTLMINDLVPEGQGRQQHILGPQQPWTLGKLTLMGYSSVTTTNEDRRVDEEIHPEASSTVQPESIPVHVVQSLSHPNILKKKKKSEIKSPEVDVQIKNSTPSEDSTPPALQAYADKSELVYDEGNDLPDTIAIARAQSQVKFAVDTLDNALFRMEEARAAIIAAIAPPNEEGVLKWLLKILVGFLFSFLWFILVVSCLFWARRHGRRSVPL